MNTKRISIESDNWSKWRKLCNDLDIPFSIEDITGVVIQSISTDTEDILQ